MITTIRRMKEMSENDKEVFRSIVEIEKKYFPRFYERKMREEITDPTALGIRLARESLDKIIKELS